MTVSGLDFGAGELTATSALEMVACSTSSWTSATTIACVSSSASTMFGLSAVSVGGVAGTSAPVFSFDAAVAEFMRLSKVYPSLGYEVVILPKVGVQDRAALVLAMLSKQDTEA